MVLTTVESSPASIQKGTFVVPAIRGFDPLVLPRPILGIFGVLNSKALEATLSSPIMISVKMLSIVPNLQTQEDVIIRIPKPFPYQDSHHVPWKYKVSLISTQTRKEEICSNISLGLSELTRPNRRKVASARHQVDSV